MRLGKGRSKVSKGRRLTKRERAELKTATKTLSAGMSSLAKVVALDMRALDGLAYTLGEQIRETAEATAEALGSIDESFADRDIGHEALLDVLFGREAHAHGTPAACGMCQRIAYAEAVERLQAERSRHEEGARDVSQD